MHAAVLKISSRAIAAKNKTKNNRVCALIHVQVFKDHVFVHG